MAKRTGVSVILNAPYWNILHIDDDEDDHILVQSMLNESQGRRVKLDWAETLKEGLHKLKHNEYEAVLVDYDLGVETGIDLIRAFVAQGYPAPFILLTGRGTYEVDVEAMRAGATLYLTKNEINPLLLERSIRYAIERRQAEADLRERDRKLSVALEAAQLGTWIYTFEDHVIEMDERAKRIYGLSESGSGQKIKLEELIHPEDLQTAQAAMAKAANPAGSGRYQVEYRIIQPAGNIRWLSVWGLAEFDGQENECRAVRLTGASRDITWEKQADLALEESNAALRSSEQAVKVIADRFKAVLENSLDVAYRRDLQTNRYDYLSPVVEQVLGFQVDEMVDMSIRETLSRIHPDDVTAVESALIQAEQHGKGRLEYRFKCKNGHYRWLADHVTVTKDSVGKPLYRTGIIRDVTDQVWAEHALRTSEERFRLASRAVTGILYDWTVGREELYQSEGLERVVGYRPGDEPGGSTDWWPRNIHPDDYAYVQEALQAAIKGKTDSFAYEYRIRHRDGHWVHIWDQGYIVRDSDGHAQRVVGIATDISERVQSEVARRESEEHFRDLANNISQLAWMADPDGSSFWFNQRWFDYTGTELEDVQGWGWQQTIHPEFRSKVIEKINSSFNRGEPWEDTFPIKNKDGEYRWFLSQAVPIKDGNGHVVRWFGTNTDVTEQQKLQKENEQQKHLLEAVLQALPVGVWITDRTGKIVGKNKLADITWAGNAPMAETISEYSLYTAWDAASGERLTAQDYPLAKVLSSGEAVDPVEVTIRRFDGSEGTLIVSAAPIKDNDGQLNGAVAITVDITERKQAEEALLASEMMMDAFFEASPGILNLFDQQLRYIKSDPLTPTYFDLDRSSIIGKSVYDLNPPFAQGFLGPIMKQVIETGQPVLNIEFSGPNPSQPGQLVDFRASYFAVPLPGGKTGMGVIGFDVTNIKRAEDALRSSEERYRLAARAVNNAIWDWDIATDAIQWNEALSDLFGYDTSQQLNSGMWWKEHIHPEDREVVVKGITEVIYGRGDVWSASYRFQCADGAYAQIYDRGWVVRNEDGTPLRMFGAMRDITQQKEAEQALRSSEENMRQLADAMPQLVWTARPDGSLDYFNQRYQLYKGISPNQAHGWDWEQVVHPDDVSLASNAWKHAIETGQQYQVELRIRMADDQFRWHLARGIPGRDEQGRIVKWYGTTTDIHELKNAQADMIAYAEKLKRSNEELESFAFVASHDLQEPLRKIIMFGGSLKRELQGQLPAEAEDYIGRMQGAAERMQAMIQGLLDLARVSTHGRPFHAVNLTRLVEEVIGDLEANIQTVGGQVSFTQLPTIEGDDVQMQQVLQNLIENALKFHQEGTVPIVEITSQLDFTEKIPCVLITIGDNGIGFDDAQTDRLFQPFIRLHGRSQFEGSGIGLAICRKIVERHGGSISASSRPGQGSRFTIRLPLTQSSL
jgi:PAS domain S-box-containing protein